MDKKGKYRQFAAGYRRHQHTLEPELPALKAVNDDQSASPTAVQDLYCVLTQCGEIMCGSEVRATLGVCAAVV